MKNHVEMFFRGNFKQLRKHVVYKYTSKNDLAPYSTPSKHVYVQIPYVDDGLLPYSTLSISLRLIRSGTEYSRYQAETQ